MWKKYLKQLNLPESYVSITLGFLVVLVAGILMYNYLSKNKTTQNPGEQQKEEAKTEESKKEENTSLPTTHKVTLGENLWSIAEKYYNSGYNWVSIAKENKLANANDIKTGQELSIPKAEIITPIIGDVSSSATEMKTYTVVKGDNLWKIAVSQYGDGYAWTKIANANKLVNANLIHPGNVLRLP